MRKLTLLAAAGFLAGFVLRAAENGAGAEGLIAGAETAANRETAHEEPVRKDPKPNPTYIEGRGFDFRTSDGLFDFAIGANLQVRFSDLDVEGPGEATEFRIRRFKLYMTGFVFDPRLTYRFQLDFANVNNVRLLDDAWVNWKFMDLLQVQAGQSKTPYGRQELMNDGILMFAERSIATDAFKPNRDTGVVLIGFSKGSVLQYAAGVFGGAGQTTLRGTDHVMPIGRVVWSTFGDPRVGEADLDRASKFRLSIGANGFYNTLQKLTNVAFESGQPSYASATGWLGQNVALFETGEDVQVGSGGVDFQAAWCGFTVQGEYFFGHALGTTSGMTLNSRGFYIEAGAMALPRLGLAARYSNVDSDRSVSGDQQTEVNGAATWYFRKNNAKLLFEYSTLHRQRSGAPANDRFLRVQVQLYM
jgi:phosphate-selective porin